VKGKDERKDSDPTERALVVPAERKEGGSTRRLIAPDPPMCPGKVDKTKSSPEEKEVRNARDYRPMRFFAHAGVMTRWRQQGLGWKPTYRVGVGHRARGDSLLDHHGVVVGKLVGRHLFFGDEKKERKDGSDGQRKKAGGWAGFAARGKKSGGRGGELGL
jgi:hypothetical protein